LTNIDDLRPYVPDEMVIHIGQRDKEETERFGSQEIRDTNITCFSLKQINEEGNQNVIRKVLETIEHSNIEQFWIHFDTDVLSDDINPAVDYRLPGGLSFEQASYFIRNLLATGKAAGISVTIYNAALDPDQSIAKNIVDCIGRAFENSFTN
jgi:arginase